MWLGPAQAENDTKFYLTEDISSVSGQVYQAGGLGDVEYSMTRPLKPTIVPPMKGTLQERMTTNAGNAQQFTQAPPPTMNSFQEIGVPNRTNSNTTAPIPDVLTPGSSSSTGNFAQPHFQQVHYIQHKAAGNKRQLAWKRSEEEPKQPKKSKLTFQD